MYDRTVDVPRLLCFYGEREPLPDPALDACRDALNAHYAPELGEGFVTAGLCFYRDGRDSVAWDSVGRDSMAGDGGFQRGGPGGVEQRDGRLRTAASNGVERSSA